MTEQLLPTRHQIDTLLHFLPRLEQPGHDFITDYVTGNHMPYPVYEPVVKEFIQVAGASHWMDYGYQPAAAAAMLYDDAVMAQADLPQIKTMLTYVVRGERFADGHWGLLLKNGRIIALLRRLAEITQ
jgi:hypothetical protein